MQFLDAGQVEEIVNLFLEEHFLDKEIETIRWVLVNTKDKEQ